MKQIFNIPEGCSKVTIEQIGNKIVTEFEMSKRSQMMSYIEQEMKIVDEAWANAIGLRNENKTDIVSPKVGDCVKMNYGIDGFAYCVVKSNNHQIHSNFFLDSLTGVQKYGAFRFYKSVEILTPTQFQSEVNALGFEYDFKNDIFKELKWVPKKNESYWFIVSTLIPYKTLNTEKIDSAMINVGNCFKTKSECESAIEKIKLILKTN